MLKTTSYILFTVLFYFNSFAQEPLSVEKIWKTYEFYAKSVQGFRGMNDGVHFTKTNQINGQSVVTKHQVTNYKGEGIEILNLTKIASDNSINTIEDYEFDSSEKKVLLTTNVTSIYRRSFTANYFIYDLATKSFEALDPSHQPQSLATFSPDGSKVAYVFANNLYFKDLEKRITVQITFDGKQNGIINGSTDWVYEEEFAITKAFDWSHDSKSLAFLKFNESKVREFTMTYYNELYPEPYTFKYPKAGESNSVVTAYLLSISNPIPKKIELGEYEYLPRISFSKNSDALILQTLNRHQNHVKYNLVTFEGSKINSTVIYEEKSTTYVEIDDNLIFIKDGKSILRTSEKDGFNHIYRIDFKGNETQITKGNWDVSSFLGVDDNNKYIYYTAGKTSPINKGVYKISLDGKKDLAISDENGMNNADFITGMNYFVLSHSDGNTPPTFTLCDNSGKTIAVMEDNQALKSKLSTYSLSKKEFISIDLTGRKLNAWVMKPANFDPSKKYPVFFHVYGGPGHNTVSNTWGGQDYMFHQLLTQKGYIVVSVDPRGTMYRGADFKKSTYLQLGKLETDDIIYTAKYFQSQSYVDANRIGIQGWSYGGFMTSLAMTKGSDVFKMGIAVAPVTNWRYYDNIYTERFMRTPEENKDGYDLNSPINFTKELKGKYLLIHGSGDDNVHYQNTMEMTKSLVEANKQFDLFIYPNKDHGIHGGNTRNHLFNMMLNYTLNNL